MSVVEDRSEGHLPVMVEEVMAALSPVAGSFLVDATVGGGGHAVRILEANAPDGRLLGLDADPAAIARTRRRLAPYGRRVTLRQANFARLAEVAPAAGFGSVDGVLLDLGLSSHQLADTARGFSFRADGPLDLRFDPSRGRPASELVSTLDATALERLLRQYGEEPHARRIARAIVRERAAAPLLTARQLADVVERAVPRTPAARGRARLHPATRTFQALRIAVNEELETLPVALAAALDLLRPGGRLAVLSYHSLEDRIVKRFVAAERRGCVCPPEVPVCVCGHTPRLRPVGPAPGRPTAGEVAANPRSRSARLRAAERVAA
ncbi:MAG TPA: 16S rRNA (cytosine(1402)-N(4))-methyltransferase RsmH [Candidatus Dormibacteraeota bacterium]|nr:16S rRNA (cytosine(1402)-N(4))-methyltransferase RsmH [Candidatus Dormibacteraeota bacterium]